MNKSELIKAVAESTNQPKSAVEQIINETFDTIEETMADGDKVILTGFGTFEPKERKAKKGRNPRTGAEIDIPAKTVPTFKPGKGLKEAVA